MGLALAVRPHGPLPTKQTALIGIALGALCLAGAVALGAAWWPAASRDRVMDRLAGPTTRAAIWLALAVWFPLLLVPAYLAARSTESYPVGVKASFGFLDKRWETSVYLLGTVVPIVLLVLADRVLDVGRAHPASWRAWLGGIDRGASPTAVAASNVSRLSVARVAAGAVTALGLGAYFYGPPWYLDRYTGNVDYHEEVHLTGIQALATGHIPYIGPGSSQYGPGAQLLSYLYMRHVSTFSVLGIRESWAFFHWIGATLFFLVLFLVLGYARGLAAALLAALVFPTLQLFQFSPGGTWYGWFGWANVLRYAGAFALLMLLPGVIRRCPSRVGIAAAVVLGVVWGATSYIGQENLLAGAIGALALAILLVVSRTASARAVGTALAGVLAGSAVVWLPALGYYAAEGVVRRFVYLYFFMPRSVAEGFTDTPYLGGLHDPWGLFFYAFPFVLFALALLSVLRFRPFAIAREWSRERVLLVTTIVTTAVLYEGALLRSDSTHLAGAALAVPALVVVAATTLPRILGATRRGTLVVAGAALVVGAFALLPGSAFHWGAVKSRAQAPYLDRRRLASSPNPPAPTTLAAKRIGAGLASAPICCTGSTWSMPRFIGLMNRIHAIVGDRIAYVTDFPDAFPGLIYFVADLRPAPIPIDPHAEVFTQAQTNAFDNAFQKTVVPRTSAVLTSSVGEPEAQDFLASYPHARRIVLTYRGLPYYVLLR